MFDIFSRRVLYIYVECRSRYVRRMASTIQSQSILKNNVFTINSCTLFSSVFRFLVPVAFVSRLRHSDEWVNDARFEFSQIYYFLFDDYNFYWFSFTVVFDISISLNAIQIFTFEIFCFLSYFQNIINPLVVNFPHWSGSNKGTWVKKLNVDMWRLFSAWGACDAVIYVNFLCSFFYCWIGNQMNVILFTCAEKSFLFVYCIQLKALECSTKSVTKTKRFFFQTKT